MEALKRSSLTMLLHLMDEICSPKVLLNDEMADSAIHLKP